MKFEFYDDQPKKYRKWYEEHNKTCPLYQNDGAIGGRLTYCFTPTSLGVITVVKCGCGEELNLTDVENW